MKEALKESIAVVKSVNVAKNKYESVINITLFSVAIVALLMGLFDFLTFLLPIMTIILGITLILCLPVVAKGPMYYSLGMWIVGTVFLIQENANFQEWQQAIGSNIDLLTLFILVPLLSLPVRYGGYTENINSFFGQLGGTKWKIHAFTNFLMALLAPILTLGAVTMIKDLTPQFKQEKTFLVSLSRMFGLTLMWTPYFGTVIFVLTLLDMEWGEIVPFTISFSFVGMLLSILLVRITNGGKKDEHESSREITSNNVNRKNIIELVVIIVFILLSTLGIYYISNLSMTITISLLSIFIPIAWLAYLRKINKLAESVKYYFNQLLPKLKGEIILMLSASFFGFAFVNSGYSHLLPMIFTSITGDLPFPFIFLLSFIMISIAIVGLHPFVLTTVFAATFSQGDIPISQTVLAITIFCSWGMALALSPFSATTLVVARDSTYSPFKVSVNWNIGFFGVLFILLVVFAYSLSLLGF